MRVPARAFSSRSLLRGFTTDTLRCIPAPAASGGAESARSRAHSKNAANPSACLCTSPSAMFHFIIVIRFSERLKIRVKTKSEIQASLVFTVIFTLVYLAHCYPYLNTYGGKPPFREHLDYLDRQITMVGTGGLLTMLAEPGSGTLAGGVSQTRSGRWRGGTRRC